MKVVHMMEVFEHEKIVNKDGREERGLSVVRRYFVMHEVALENLQMRDA